MQNNPITAADLKRGSLVWDSETRQWYIKPFSRWRTDFILPRNEKVTRMA